MSEFLEHCVKLAENENLDSVENIAKVLEFFSPPLIFTFPVVKLVNQNYMIVLSN